MTGRRIEDAEYATALAAGRDAAATEFRAEAVAYLADRDAIEVITQGNCGFVIPRALIGVLEAAKPDDLARMAVWPDGSVIEIEHLDIHIHVDGMIKAALPFLVPGRVMAGLFAAYGGAATSAAKASSSRRNGMKGGRPKKAAVIAGVG